MKEITFEVGGLAQTGPSNLDDVICDVQMFYSYSKRLAVLNCLLNYNLAELSSILNKFKTDPRAPVHVTSTLMS